MKSKSAIQIQYLHQYPCDLLKILEILYLLKQIT